MINPKSDPAVWASVDEFIRWQAELEQDAANMGIQPGLAMITICLSLNGRPGRLIDFGDLSHVAELVQFLRQTGGYSPTLQNAMDPATPAEPPKVSGPRDYP